MPKPKRKQSLKSKSASTILSEITENSWYIAKNAKIRIYEEKHQRKGEMGQIYVLEPSSKTYNYRIV
jgi:hypothetical protein